MTCKQRRVKCDEKKPECQACHRLKLHCGGYRAKYTPRFKDQNHKFCKKDVDCRSRDIVKIASSDRSYVSDVQERIVMTALTSRLSEPDTAVPFYLGHYASMGRDMESTRGFFELLIPVYRSEREESALSLAVSVLASEVLSLWRQDASSFQSPRKSYSRAITRLRNAIQDPTERSKPATVLAVLVLQTYENASAIYDLRSASSTHHNGAATLISFLNTHDLDVTMRDYLQNFMLHTEISTAIRQKKPLNSITYSWVRGEESMAVPQNPSSRLDIIGATVAELQASYMQFVRQGSLSTSLNPLLKDWMAEAKRIDANLLVWAENVPHHWRPVRLISGRDIDSSIPTYQTVCEVYPSCQIASVWNFWRFQRLLLAKITLRVLTAFSDMGRIGMAHGQPLYVHTDLVDCQQTLQEVVDSVCYSIPFYLGNRATRSNLTEFTDPKVLLPSQYTFKEGTRLNSDGIEAGLSRDDHRRHIIAQGPWRAMHPLSHLLTLFSETHNELFPGFPRSGQRDWIRSQFMRVAKLLHLPPESGNHIKKSELTETSSDCQAESLARGVRKGAILMSGP